MIRSSYTDSFSFNRNNYIELYAKGYKDACNFQLKIRVVDFEEIEQERKEFTPKEEKEDDDENID